MVHLTFFLSFCISCLPPPERIGCSRPFRLNYGDGKNIEVIQQSGKPRLICYKQLCERTGRRLYESIVRQTARAGPVIERCSYIPTMLLTCFCFMVQHFWEYCLLYVFLPCFFMHSVWSRRSYLRYHGHARARVASWQRTCDRPLEPILRWAIL